MGSRTSAHEVGKADCWRWITWPIGLAFPLPVQQQQLSLSKERLCHCHYKVVPCADLSTRKLVGEGRKGMNDQKEGPMRVYCIMNPP